MRTATPSTTLRPPTRVVVTFCLTGRPDKPGPICTRIKLHGGHCCDEILGESWNARGRDAVCRADHDHSAEKGMAGR